MIKPIIGAISGCGVKLSKCEKWPSTNIHVSTPIVEPRVSALISAALIGSTRDPNARNIRMVVVVISSTTINGSLPNRLWMLSCSRAGVPPTDTSSRVAVRSTAARSIFSEASLRSTNPFWMTRTDGSFDAPSRYGRSFHMLAGSLSGSMNPDTVIASLRISAIC